MLLCHLSTANAVLPTPYDAYYLLLRLYNWLSLLRIMSSRTFGRDLCCLLGRGGSKTKFSRFFHEKTGFPPICIILSTLLIIVSLMCLQKQERRPLIREVIRCVDYMCGFIHAEEYVRALATFWKEHGFVDATDNETVSIGLITKQ